MRPLTRPQTRNLPTTLRRGGLDYDIDFGRASYEILLVLERGAKDYEAILSFPHVETNQVLM